MTNEEPRIIKFKTFPAPSGGLITLGELGDKIPFDIKNIYWLHHIDRTYKKGNHANRLTKQIVIPLKGSINAKLISSEDKPFSFLLDQPNLGLYIPNLYWKEFLVEKGSVVLSITSHAYEENDNFYDYKTFIESFK